METDRFIKPRSFLDRLRSVFSAKTPAEHIEELEQAMIEADIDLDIVEELTSGLRSEKIPSFEAAKYFLKKYFAEKLREGAAVNAEKRTPVIILLVGINGAGKTTTAAKLASLEKKAGKKVMFIAADTFRAAAAEQLEEWAQRTGVEIIKGMDGADPASVVFDGLAAAKKRGYDTIIIDTAGRLHTKESLMQELLKIKKTISKEASGYGLETYIIVDANTGKNAYNQAKQFDETIGLTGVILTKFDSTSKGGSVVKIKADLKLPIVYYTFGEKAEDIDRFDAEKFVEKLFE